MSWLNNNIIKAAQNLLRIETNLFGSQSPLLGTNYHFIAINLTSGLLQILHVNGNHWVTVTKLVV